MFQMILWKEWKENFWKLLFCGLVSAVFTIMLFRIRLIPDISNCFLISFVQLFVVPIVYSLDIFSGEMSNRTIYFLFKIPVPRWMIFFSKFIVSAVSIVIIFIISSILMEVMSHGREAPVFYLMGINMLFSAAVLLLFTWFCLFGCQSRSEAGSLAILFAVGIGWGIVLLWSSLCNVTWAERFVPFSFILTRFREIGLIGIIFSQVPAFLIVSIIACYRYASIRRYL
ncbi:MAG: ABC transporter permease subunit [Sedimentisphaerales bacterium]|nr:ABC transporter permease subunit [Sedimentisphaerales bacterium]